MFIKIVETVIENIVVTIIADKITSWLRRSSHYSLPALAVEL